MLQALSIRNFIIVDSLDLEFEPGFTTLTGETGAGKSILIDALSLALGARNEGAVTRANADKAEISATFFIQKNAQAQAWLLENEIETADELILRRIIYSDGRSRSFINGATVTVAQLKALGEYLVDIYSQNAHHSLLNAQTQRQLLDEFAGCVALSQQVANLFQSWNNLNQQRLTAEQNASAYANELAELRDQVRELTQLNFTLEDWQSIQLEHARLSHGAALINGSELCIQLLEEAEPAVLSLLHQVQQQLTELVNYDASLNEPSELVNAAAIQLQEAVRALNRYLQRAELEPEKLSEIENRMQAIHNTARKCRLAVEGLPDLLNTSQQRMAELESLSDDGELAKKTSAAQAEYTVAAKALSEQRKSAALKLSQAITQEMQRLSLSGGQFKVGLNPVAPSLHGLEVIEFLVAGHAGVEPRPLSKVASGGELSRISLALHVSTAAQSSVPCMIFDEVDVGIGGGVAEVVGQLLKALGKNRQVLVITHLPQVAALASQHLQVSKTQHNNETLSHIHLLDQAQRIDEIARMSGGLVITEATRNHAKAMLGL